MRMIGTGKDPEGRYPEGLQFDVPDVDPGARPQGEYLIEQGYAEYLKDPKDDTGRTQRQIAEAVVRGDLLNDPVDREIAEDIGGKAYELVHEDSTAVVLGGSGSGFSDDVPSGPDPVAKPKAKASASSE